MNHLLSSFLLLTLLSSAREITFTTDNEWHFTHKIQKQWVKADATKDGVITIADKGGWHHNKRKDTDGDGQITQEEFSLPVPLENAGKAYYNVVYKEASGKKCLLDIYLPKKRKGDLSPVYYFTHGGGWAAGNKDLAGNMEVVMNAMLAEGITCVSAAYRLVTSDVDPPIVMEDCVTDCKDGLRFISMHAEDLKLDMDKVCVFGNSAGGHISLMLAYTSPESFLGVPEYADYHVKPVAGINWYGPVSFLKGSLFTHPTKAKAGGNPNRFAGRMMAGGKAVEYTEASSEQQAVMKRLSPLTYLTKDSVPILTMHGDSDTTIPHLHSELLVEKAQEIGAPVTYLAVKNAGHGFKSDSEPPFSELLEKMVEFAVKHLY